MNHLLCIACGETFRLDEPRWRCTCGGLLDISWEPAFELAQIARRKPTMWRYREAIPLRRSSPVVSFDEGLTPLLRIELEGAHVWVKQDQLFPSGSYKDRGASVLVSKVAELGIDRVVEDSSGNAGAAIAAYCARAGISCTIYVPESTSPAKLAQIEGYGADVHRIPGTREDTARAAFEVAQTTYYASHSWNPFFFHGVKTFAYEVCEQLGWRAPDVVVLPVGNGTLLLGAAVGFQELRSGGVSTRIPRLVGVQAERCAPLYRAWRDGRDRPQRVQKGDTIAEGIAIADPIRGRQLLSAVRESGGGFLIVSEEEIGAALRAMWRAGFYIEPTSAATIAGLYQYLRRQERDEVIVSTFTGHGLKAAGKAKAASSLGREEIYVDCT
jgi:threonine synthase